MTATTAASDHSQAALEQQVKQLRTAADKIKHELGKMIVGQQEVIEQLLIALFVKGHCLFEGVPGLAKTLLVSSLAEALTLRFRRIQFTPDLMPSDVTGTEIMGEAAAGKRQFHFVQGPVFANLVLADEINRAPPKTQAALLEAMEERQVTAGGDRHELPKPFLVLATQNPLEQEGTYPLPEAQLDRFLFKVLLTYPHKDEEMEIARRRCGPPEKLPPFTRVLDAAAILQYQQFLPQVLLPNHVCDYAVRLARATRPDEKTRPKEKPSAEPATPKEVANQWIQVGAGPRAVIALIHAARARAALLRGELGVGPLDVEAMARPVLRHRIILKYEAAAEHLTADDVIGQLLAQVPKECPEGKGRQGGNHV